MDLNELRSTFLRRLSTAQDLDDPLALHQSYIESLKAIPETPSASIGPLLLEALERTTQAFIEDRRYANDPRYLRVWLDYAVRCREPEDVFAFLGMKGVCLDLAAYYEEYAGYLERRKLDQPGSVEKISQIFLKGIGRKAQPLERLKKYYNEFLHRHCPEQSAKLEPDGQLGDKRQSWSSAPAPIKCWTAAAPPKRNIEIHGYKAELLQSGQLCFEEVRAACYRAKKILEESEQLKEEKLEAKYQLTMIDVAMAGPEDHEDDDGLDDVPSLAVAVNPEDLTHISVYRDNTLDLKELARLAASHNYASTIVQDDKENRQEDAVMTPAAAIEDEDDPFEKIQQLEACDSLVIDEAWSFERRRKDRLSLIPEEPELTTSHSIRAMLQQPMSPEERSIMESKMNPGLIPDLLVVHESALAKVRTLEKTVGRDGVGGNQTVSALRIANGHFFIERRLSPNRLLLAVDLEADVASGKCNQWALKILSPPSLWEPFILSKIHASSQLFPKLNLCCHYNDVLFMTCTYYEQGSLLNALQVLQKFDELLVLFYASQMLQMLDCLISAGMVHTRISLDHLMIRSTDFEGTWTPQFHADGSGGWASKGLALLGFSKAVDMSLLVDPSFSLDGSCRGHEHDMRAISKAISHMLSGTPEANISIGPSHQFAHLWNKILALLFSKFVSNTSIALQELLAELGSTLELASTQCSPTLKSSLTRLEIALLNTQ